MKIKCINNRKSTPQKTLSEEQIYYDPLPLIIGKEYVVYAVGEFENATWYCICDEHYTYYPMWRPFPLFGIVDNRLSRYWVFSLQEWENKKQPLISFPEWANDSYFYGELVEGNSNDQNAVTFRKYKELMDLEFPDKAITEIAEIGDSDWLICPTCIDAWDCPNAQDGMVTCPKCKKIMNNPRYRARLKTTN